MLTRFAPALRCSCESPTTPVGAGMKFHCSDEQGAFVFMNVPAEKNQLLASQSLIPFIRHNIDRWHEYAQTKFDLLIAREQIIFISGVTKTEDWGLGAFVNQAKGGEVAFTAQVPFFQGTFSVQKQKTQTGNIQYRAKPLDDARSVRSPRASLDVVEAAGAEAGAGPSSPAPGSTSSLTTPPKRDQTLFFHYYKMKARWWVKRIIKAAAGPDERDPDRSGDGEDIAAGLQMDDESDVVQEPPIDQVRLLGPLKCRFTEAGYRRTTLWIICSITSWIIPWRSARPLSIFCPWIFTSPLFAGWHGSRSGDRERSPHICAFRELFSHRLVAGVSPVIRMVRFRWTSRSN